MGSHRGYHHHDHGNCANCKRKMISRWNGDTPLTQRPSWVKEGNTYILVCPACFIVKYRHRYQHIGGLSTKPTV